MGGGVGMPLRVGSKLFSGMEEGYDRTLHIKFGKPGCKSFHFKIFFISEGGIGTPLMGRG